jgi:L-asparaginase
MIDDGMDGIIITHGMDTLQYTAAYLGYSFSSCDLPIMIVTSFKPLDQEGSTGLTNLRCSVDFIRNHRGTGVFVPYSSDNETTYIHVGTRLLQNYDYELDVRSIFDLYAGYYDSDGYHPENTVGISDVSCIFSDIQMRERSGIMVIRPYVGMPSVIIPDDVEDVVMVPYRSGTMDLTDNALTGLLDFCRSKGIRLWMVGKLPGIDYNSMSGLDSVSILPPMTAVSAYMKLWMLKSAGTDLKYVSSPCAGDIENAL